MAPLHLLALTLFIHPGKGAADRLIHGDDKKKNKNNENIKKRGAERERHRREPEFSSQFQKTLLKRAGAVSGGTGAEPELNRSRTKAAEFATQLSGLLQLSH